MNSKEQIYDTWAPASSPWSPWAKPVLFTVMPVITSESILRAPMDHAWISLPAALPGADGATAVVANLPGRDGVAFGLALAARGYRPVPLYNAVPAPSRHSFHTGLSGAPTAVDVMGIAVALQEGADRLAALSLRDEAPPVFLLDRDRAGSGGSPPPNTFDNRSVSFTTDFPSAPGLQSRGIRRVILVQPDPTLAADLAHTLRRWQDAGIVIEQLVPGDAPHPAPLHVPKPGWFGFVFQRVLIAFGLRRNPAGGFGGWVPEPSSSG